MKSKAGRVAAFLTTIALSAGLIGAAAQTTGAYFSDTQSGTVSGTLGSIKVTTSGGTGASNLDVSFTNLLPADPQTLTTGFQNTGRNPEDVWVVFPNADALHAINDLGNYGEVHIASSGTEVFGSKNLNDNTTSCPPGSQNLAHLPHPQNPCNALPQMLKLADNLGTGASGTMAFTFNYVSYLTSPNVDSPVPAFNCYPINPANDKCDSPAGNGLPYQIVATQHGILPGA
ncbi:MAG TPA: hypothetical protein VGJ03_02615 [Acidimicrobiales bacterium]|jgi:hypothetical protein